ncbi:pimeloyl-ACP methyl ester carboxylesterase [Natronospira proteinivora]|uniref:Pimeloyl-ACP methyl ester carboxylesterase n=1 Tax=Natronospira proteinivora TaxID=1807133 RepID=A0ABT1GAY0_9GAMM|nr:alpha/beta fold hydrolase [Natronospira proteinivora]MCP1727473.1 pimeloyl-ACP methyl ester carboxylesterase [Natronospira proteinivora]
MSRETATEANDTVVFIHGLWMTGLEMFFLRRMVRDAGYDTEQFSYRTMAGTLDENAHSLKHFLESLNARPIHLVAHSLGGLLSLYLFNELNYHTDGKLVFLGSPVRGSQAARALADKRIGEMILGRSGQQGLLQDSRPEWRHANPLGILAGTRGVGVGAAMSDLEKPNDGAVAVSETHIPGASDRIELDVTHASMLMSRAVGDQVIHFLRTSRFDHEADAE